LDCGDIGDIGWKWCGYDAKVRHWKCIQQAMCE
jgi:hypothetical protein